MRKFYKIVRADLELFIMYNEATNRCLQVGKNTLIVSKGVFIGWQDSTEQEFFKNYQLVVNKIQEELI